jgi:hypothetical protein
MGRRSRRREKVSAPTSDYAGPEGEVLTLRGSLSPSTRREYAALVEGGTGPAQTQEDIWQRAVEFLFERLAVRWTIAGVETTKQKELLQRYRVATSAERTWVRDALREHLAEWFPDVQAP